MSAKTVTHKCWSRYGYYASGYQGGGPGDLAEAVVALRSDAAIDLRGASRTARPRALAEFIYTHEPPLYMSEELMDELLPRRGRPVP
jgi:hypothetical protein